MAYFVILLFLIVPKLNAEVFSSTAHLSDVLNTEHEIVNLIEKVIEDTEAKVSQLRKYINDFKSMSFITDVVELVGNPILAYQLLRHFTLDWKKIQTRLNNTAWQDLIVKIRNKRESLLMQPEDEDLQGAARALIRLQQTYRLNVSDLANGNILGFQSFVGLSARDCFYLGQHCSYLGYFNLAVEWHELALRKAQEDGSMNPENIISILEQAIKSKEFVSVTTENPDSNKLLKDRSSIEVKNANMPNYQALCRGEQLRTHAEESKLFCYLSNQSDAYFNLMPIKIEVQNLDPPIYILHDIIYDSEIEYVKELSKPLLERSQIVGAVSTDYQVSSSRTSKNTWLFDSIQDEKSRKVLQRIITRAGWITKLNIHGEENSEALQVSNYGIGGHYEPHPDYLFKDRTPEELSADDERNLRKGDRLATLMFYLSDVERGGATVFPHIGAALWPKKGSAAFWYNLLQNGDGDPLTLHGGCPVLIGSKWVANKWIREVNQVFRRPCSLNPLE